MFLFYEHVHGVLGTEVFAFSDGLLDRYVRLFPDIYTNL